MVVFLLETETSGYQTQPDWPLRTVYIEDQTALNVESDLRSTLSYYELTFFLKK